MFRLWAADILANVPLESGVFFFSISPQTKDGALAEDSGYLQASLRWLMQNLWTVDAAKLRRQTPNHFMKDLALELLKRPDLEIISVWSPSYLLTLLTEIRALKPDWQGDTRSIFPNLKFISVWGSAMAETGFAEVRRAFPGVRIQAKGLLATEAPLTIPWFASGSFVPLVQDVFFEFIGANSQVFLLHELEPGETYEILITTAGGLFRYRLGDLVKVTRYYQRTPCLEFIGRSGEVCDLAGEKISEVAVRKQLKEFENDLGFSLLIPDIGSMNYILYCSRRPFASDFGQTVDRSLRQIYHYGIAREQNQLGGLKLVHIPDLREIYYEWLTGRRMRLGDIKEKSLIADLALAAQFSEFVNRRLPQSAPFSAWDRQERDL